MKTWSFGLPVGAFRFQLLPLGDPKNNQKKTEPADFKETSRFSILDDILGLAAQDNVNWNVYKTVNKIPHRFPVQADTHNPLKRLDLNFIIWFYERAPTKNAPDTISIPGANLYST